MIKLDELCSKMKLESNPIYNNPYLKPFIDAYFAYPGKHKYNLFQGYIPNNERIIANFLEELKIKNSRVYYLCGNMDPEEILTPSHKKFKIHSYVFQKAYGFFMTYFIGYNIRKNNVWTPIFIYNEDKTFENVSLKFTGFYQNLDFKEPMTPYKTSLWHIMDLSEFKIDKTEYNYTTKKWEENPFITMSKATARALKEQE